MLTARERLARQKARPALVELHRALSRLTSTLTVMNTGAHPDDEQSGMLATLRFGFGMRVIIACSTRGEGGQNSLGPERTGALGVVRTREMEEAARVLDADIVWLGHGSHDRVHDFGFSKNGPDTLARWGRDTIIDRLVVAYRSERPDIVIPTFLDVPGQHGHHRAMTEAAEAAIALAADPAYLTPGLSPWQVAKYYLPAWSGGGDTYDDEVPPPAATVRVVAPGNDTPTGAAFDDIGEWSRAYHASQGMGRWQKPDTEWALHLKLGTTGAEASIQHGLPATLGELAEGLPAPAAASLGAAQMAINTALQAFPDRPAITEALLEAAAAIETAIAGLPPEHADRIGHRLNRKLVQIDAALLLAANFAPTAWAEPNRLAPGGTGVLGIDIGQTDLAITLHPRTSAKLILGAGETRDGLVHYPLTLAPDAPVGTIYPASFSSLGGNGPLGVDLEAKIGGRTVRGALDLEEDFSIVPAHSVELMPEAVIIRQTQARAPIAVAMRSQSIVGTAALVAPEGWGCVRTATGFTLTPPAKTADGLYQLPLRVDGRQAYRQTPIAYPHIGRTQFIAPQSLSVLALDLSLPDNRIGYVGGGSDRVGYWLNAMGLDATDLDAGALSGDLSGFTTIVIGTFAFGLRPDLAAATAKLHEWVRAGGHLLTLYHRPADGWNPNTTPPLRLVIGSPSLRWRVTDPHAAVTVLEPDHKLLTGPNPIGPYDWAGWDKERGLYFASQWDPAYVPLLAMHDAEEQPLKGALVSAPVGKGRHTHTSLVLHHQLDRLVPGAFRLLANLVQPA